MIIICRMSLVMFNNHNFVYVGDIFKEYKCINKAPKNDVFIQHLNIDTSDFVYVSINKKNGFTILDKCSKYKLRRLFISNEWVVKNDIKLKDYFDKSEQKQYPSKTTNVDTIDKLRSQIQTKSKNHFMYLVTSPLISVVKVGVWSGSVSKLMSRYRVYYGKNLLIHVYNAGADDTNVIERNFIVKFQDKCKGGELFDKNAIQDYKSYLKECTKNESFQPKKSTQDNIKKEFCFSNLPVLPALIDLSNDDYFSINGKRIEITIRGDRSLQYTFFKVLDIGKTFNFKRLKDRLRDDVRGKDYVYFLNKDVLGKKDTKSNNNKVLYFTIIGLLRFVGRLREKQLIHDDFLNWIITNVFCQNANDETTKKLKVDLQKIYEENFDTKKYHNVC